MADFQASFTNTEGEISVFSTAGIIHATDCSNYTTNSEDGHALADFSLYRRMKLTLPDGTFRISSSVVEDDASSMDPASVASSLEELISHADFGDWEYELTLYTVPTYDASVIYAQGDCVYVNGVGLFKALQTAENKAPATETTYWVLVDDPDDLSSKYLVTLRWAVTYDSEQGWMHLVAEANRDSTGKDLKLIPNNLKFLSALKVNLLLDAITSLTEVRDWIGVRLCITQIKEILNDDSFRG